MKTLLTTTQNQFKKIALLGALTAVPALALTSSAQAAPRFQAPHAGQYDRDHFNRNDNHRDPAPRFDARYDNRYSTPQRYDVRNDHRFDNRGDDHRYDYARKDNNSNDTGKLLGAGLIGAVLGAVLSH